MILDTSVLLAALDKSDGHHLPCSEVLEHADEDLIVPVLVMAELGYWCHKRLTDETWLIFLEDVIHGAYRSEPPNHEDFQRCSQLQWKYRDLQLGVVDASLIALAERLGIHRVATLDHRHFASVKPSHATAFDLRP